MARPDVPPLNIDNMAGDSDIPAEVRAAAALVLGLSGDDATGALHGVSSELAERITWAAQAIRCEAAAPPNAALLQRAAQAVAAAADSTAVARAMWSAFCPDAANVGDDWSHAVEELRKRRRLRDVVPADTPIEPDELLLTANVLLTTPLGPVDQLPPDEAAAVAAARSADPVAFFDHPVPLDTPAGRHELVYGLKALDQAIAVEKHRGLTRDRVPVVLSVSTTHEALDRVACSHLARMLGAGPLQNLELFAFTEQHTSRLIQEVIAPALGPGGSAEGVERVFGVAGAYGRHYTFLKAIAPLWSLLVDPSIRATFKLDLDQAFPQSELLAQTGESALEHLCSPRWGGTAVDSTGVSVALELVAGSLVNDVEIEQGIHVPDVARPGHPERPEDYVFYPVLPQALSTEAEMMPTPTGEARRRIHVTGGTTGATVAGMRRFRLFSPSFWGRAEDQAFTLSAGRGPGPATLHLPHLVMRHDKHSFAGPAIEAAAVDKLIGDLERILMFSAYARLLDPELQTIKAELGPFTGCFISPMPLTVAYLHLAVATLSWAHDGRPDAARLFASGSRRLDAAHRFTATEGPFAAAIDADRQGWNDYYNALDRLEAGLDSSDPQALAGQQAALAIVGSAMVK